MHSFPSCGLPLIEDDQKDVEEYLLLVVTWEVDQGGHPHPPLNDPENDRTVFKIKSLRMTTSVRNLLH